MSLHETKMTLWYWNQVGGTLIEEYVLVPATATQGRRAVDGLIILGEEKRILPAGSKVDISGKDVVVVQAKNHRLGMSLMGQALFSGELVKRLNPKSFRSVAVCIADDPVLRPLIEAYEWCKVVVYPGESPINTSLKADGLFGLRP